MEEKGVKGGSGASKTLEFHNMACAMNPLYPEATGVKEPRLRSRPCEQRSETRSSRMSRIKNRKEEGTSENDVEKQMADSKTALRLAHEFDQSDTVLSIALSQDGTKLAAGGYDNKVTLYDLKTKSILHTFDRSNVINTVALSQDGTKLAAGVVFSQDGTKLAA
eukprot:g9764.t1